MEEKNEDNEKNDNINVGNGNKVGFFTKFGNFLKLTINFVILGFIALIVSAYYIKDVRDIIQSIFPDIKLPYHTAEVKDDTLHPNIENLTPISNLVRKADNPTSEVKEEKPLLKQESIAEKSDIPAETVKTEEKKNETVVTDPAETKQNEAVNNSAVAEDVPATEGAAISDVKAELSEEVITAVDQNENKDDDIAKVIKDAEKDKAETNPNITKEVMDKVMANIENSGKFTASSFDPVKKSEEKLPADKYAAASLEEKFLDLMNRNSDLVAIVKQMNERVASLEATRIDPVIVSALIEKMEALQKRVNELPTTGSASALVIAASHLRYAVLSGEGFVYELDTLKLLASKNAELTATFSSLDEYAVSGVKTAETLKEEFNDAVAKADGHLLADKTDDLKGKILNKMSELVVIKRIDGKPVNEGLLKLSNTVLPMLEAGKIDDAVVLVEKENSEALEYFKDFLADAKSKAKVMNVMDKINIEVADNFKAKNTQKK